MKSKAILTNLGNYYGDVKFISVVENSKHRYYMELDNWNGPSRVEISERMFDEAKKISSFKEVVVKEVIGVCGECLEEITEDNLSENKDLCLECYEFWEEE